MIGKIGKLKSISYKNLEPKFHYSLVDYWDFSKYSNTDTTHNIVGVNGNELIPFNFSYTLNSGYGKYEINYLSFNNIVSEYEGNRTQSYFHLIKKLSTNSIFVFAKISNNSNPGTFTMPSYNIRITGLKENEKFLINIIKHTGEASEVSYLLEANKDGEYSVPSVSMEYIEGETINYNYTLKDINNSNLNVLIEQIPQYEGAIVTDGIDDYLKLDKVGYKVGTVILKYIPLFRDNNWRYVFDVTEERCYFASSKDSGVFVTSMQYKSVGDYTYLIPRTGNNPTVSNTPFHIGCNASVSEFSSMALYDIAIYEDILTNEEVLEQVDAMNSYKLVQDYTFDKSNSDVDRDKVYNKLNPNEYIELYNFGYSLNSGYGLYKENYIAYKAFITLGDKRVDLTHTDSKIHITEIYTTGRKFIESNNLATTDYSVRISGLTDDVDLYFNGTLLTGNSPNIKLVNGINHLTAVDLYGGFLTRNFTGKCDITIEQIPEYPDHLVFDGINDHTSAIPNFNPNEGTILVQYKTVFLNSPNFMSYDEISFTGYEYAFFIENSKVQCRGIDVHSKVEIPIVSGSNISAFAYDSQGINIFNNGIFKTSNYINKHNKYRFGVSMKTALFSKLALKRIKIFNKKLTENQIKKEYNKLLNE